MRIRRCTWWTARRPPQRLAGMSLPVDLRLARSFEAASSLSSGDMLRGEPRIACWTSARSLCASSTSLVPSSKRRRERSSIDSISTRRAGRVASAILLGSLCFYYWPGWAEATSVLVLAAVRICTVVAPLSTSRVSGSPTWLRIPIWALSRPAASSRLVSPGLRGAGPPNNASIACCCASAGESPAVPATGGARLKSGGMISGALRATANSSGLFAWPFKIEQPPVVTAAASTRTVKALRMFDSRPGLIALWLIRTADEGAQQQDHDGDANRRIADIEYQKRPPLAKMEVGEVDDIAMTSAVEDIAERAAQHHAKRDLVDAVLLAAHPEGDAERDGRRQR